MSATRAVIRRKRSLVDRESQTPVIQFALWKSLRYRTRVRSSGLLCLLGFALQVAFVNVLPGLPFLLGALLLTWVQGFDNKLDRRGARMRATWEEAPLARLDDILAQDRKMRRWDESFLDISNPVGCVTFLLALVGIGGACFLLAQESPAAAYIVGVDSALLITSQWFNGMRTIDTRGDLVLRARHVHDVLAGLAPDAAAPGEMKLRMRMAGPDDRRQPLDFKLTVDYPEGPESFYGVQAQVVINRVQGTAHPYFYACLVAKRGMRLPTQGRPRELPSNVILETQEDDDVDVIVLRQRTTRTSGYRTRPQRSRKILVTALEAAARFATR